MSEPSLFMVYLSGVPLEDLVGILRADTYPTRWSVFTLLKRTINWKRKKRKEFIANESVVLPAT